MAVGFCFLHKIIDGTTLSGFLRRWAAVARGCMEEEGGGRRPEYEAAAAIFPGRDSLLGKSWLSKGYSPFVGEEGRICRRRFNFEGGAILELKEEVKTKSVKNPTSVEVVTGFVWKHMMRAARNTSASQRPSVIISYFVSLT